MIESYLAGYDYNLPLPDAEKDPVISARRQMLAAIGRQVGLDSGYYDAQALAACLLDMAREQNEALREDQREAKGRLEDLLGHDDLGYQMALYRVVAIIPAADAAADICWLADLMRRRADMARPLRAMGLNPALPGR